MATREELLDHLWATIINPLWDPVTFDTADLATIRFATVYETVLGTLYAICEPGVDDNDAFGLYEELDLPPAAQWHPKTNPAPSE